MKVLFLNAGNETGGGMVHILHMLEALTKRGEGEFVLAVLEEGAMKEKAEALDIPVVSFTETRFPFLEALRKYICDERFTHVHTHGPRANVWMASLKGKVPCEWVTTVHSDPLMDFAHKGWYGKLLSQMHIRALKKTDKIITVSDAFHPVLQGARVMKPIITTIHNGVIFHDDDVLDTKIKREDIGVADDALLFMQVARLEKVKAHTHALQAFRHLVKVAPHARLVFVGGGSLEDRLREQVAELGLDDEVIFLGERKDVAALLELADMMVLTSVSEGFPYVLLEAAQAKKPVIATDVGDVSYLVHEESGGWLVEAGSEIGVTRAMEEAAGLQAAEALQARGEALHAYARSHFSLEKSVDKLLEVYKK